MSELNGTRFFVRTNNNVSYTVIVIIRIGILDKGINNY